MDRHTMEPTDRHLAEVVVRRVGIGALPVLTQTLGLQQAIDARSIRVGDTVIKTRGYWFAESHGVGDRHWEPDASNTGNVDGATSSPVNITEPTPLHAAARSRRGGLAVRGSTRFKPPSDVVKLSDRLYYLLQPPLEQLVGDARLDFPFQPFPYQLEGIAFLYPRLAAILADEMGLGKTMQAITSVRLLLRTGHIRSCLLICPKPLLSNWQREFRLWAPELPIAVIQGDAARRQWQWETAQAPIKIANYELLVRDREWLLEQASFDLVILDEAQRIKNRSSTTSQIACGIRRQRSWALTGTPVENSTDDLLGIFEFLAPGHLHADMRVSALGDAARDFILRRTKHMVLKEMPPKMFRDADLDLTAEQWQTYRAAEDKGIIRLNQIGAELTVHHVFELVLRLKQICNFDPVTGASAKLERLTADLDEVVASGQKAIVFSQWVQTLDRLRPALADHGVLEYHGRVPHARRERVIEQFKQDGSKHVLLMSYGAGSVGLNLQFCQYVFLFDRWWNPAVEDQAINRAHRLGVTGPVTVTRMLAVGTIEQRINDILEEKRALFAEVLGQPTAAKRAMGLTQEEIFSLFRLGSHKPASAA
jgi:SNF2 family DNA or RNA helicase